MNKTITLPYFRIFLTVATLFWFSETQFLREQILGDTYFHFYKRMFLYQIFIIYTSFLVLVNYGVDMASQKKILIWSLIIIGGVTFINYLGIFGAIDIIKKVDESQVNSTRLITGIIHPNGLSVNAVFAIFLLVIVVNKKVINISNWMSVLVVLYFLVAVILNASRGAFIIFVVGITLRFVMYSSNKYLNIFTKVIFTILVIFVFKSSYDYLFEHFYIFKRLSGTTATAARATQIYQSWHNFTLHPWFGVGFYAAARGKYSVIRSNFSYTQILASYGIFVFLIYMRFLTKLIGTNYKDSSLMLLMIVSYMALMFYNPGLLFNISVVAYLNYCSYNTKTKQKHILKV